MKNIGIIFQPSLLAVLLCAAGLFYSSAANAHVNNSDCHLCDLAKVGNVSEIEAHCREADASTLAQGKDSRTGRTAVLMAANGNHTSLVEDLIDRDGIGNCDPADPHSPNLNNRTPLMWAAQHGNIAVGEALVGKLASDRRIHLVNHEKTGGRNIGWTAADFAAEHGNDDFLVELIVKGNARFGEHDVFAGAEIINFLGTLRINHPQHEPLIRRVVRKILETENLNPPFGGHDTLFEWALSGGDGAGTLFFKPMFKDAAKKAGLDLDENEFYIQASYVARHHSFNSGSIESLLGRAAYYGRLNLVKFLYELGADINQPAPVISFGWNWHFPALWSAMRGNKMDVFTYLLTRDDYNDTAINGRGSLYAIHSASGLTHSNAPQMIDDLLARHPQGSRYFVNVPTLGESVVTPLWIATKGPVARGWSQGSWSRFNYDGQRAVLEKLFEYPIDMFQHQGFTRAIYIGDKNLDLYMEYLEDNPDLVRNRANRDQIFDSIATYTRNFVVRGWMYGLYSPLIIANLKDVISRLNDINLNCSSFTVPYNGASVSYRVYLESILDDDGASFVEEFQDILDQCPPEYEQVHVPLLSGASSAPSEATSKFIEIPEDLEIPGLYLSEEPLEDFQEANQ